MIDCGVEAVIIKCAALGLEERHLGRSLAEMQSRLEDLVRSIPVVLNVFAKFVLHPNWVQWSWIFISKIITNDLDLFFDLDLLKIDLIY